MPQTTAMAANTKPSREQVEFSNLDEVVQRLEQLHRDGYQSLGNWNMAQVCEHLSDWMEYMIDGYPQAPFPVNVMLWGIRVTMGKAMLRKMLTSGKMTAGGPTMKQTVHPRAKLEDETSLSRIKETIERFKAHRGPYHRSPLFGPFTAEEGLQLQLVHCAHHVSFLVPA